MKGWPSPYENTPVKELQRLNVDVPISDHMLLRSVCPYYGFLTTAFQTFHAQLVNHIKTHNLTYGDAEEFLTLVRNSTSRALADDSVTRSLSRSTPSVGADTPSATHKSAGVKKATKNRQRNKKQ